MTKYFLIISATILASSYVLANDNLKKDKYGLVPGQAITTLHQSGFKKPDLSKFENKKCDEFVGSIHRDTLTVHEICKQAHGVCPAGNRNVLKQVYCLSKYKTDCYLGDRWSLENPSLKFAKKLDYSYMESNKNVRDGEWVTETCVYW